MQQAYVCGVSTRKVDQLVESLGLRVSRSVVSRICAGLDEQVEAFRTRPLEGRYPYLWLDAKVEKVRDGGRVVRKCLVIAHGVHESGRREVIGLDCGECETEAFWRDFLRSLVTGAKPLAAGGRKDSLGTPARQGGRIVKVALKLALLSVLVLTPLGGGLATAATAPPAPTPLSPADGADVLVPFTISWSAVSDPSGIVAYNWQVSPSSTFSPVIQLNSTMGPTHDTVSGLANGTYFWRVQAVNGNFVQGPWSQPQSFNVKGGGPGSPGSPTLNPTKGGTQFHPFETITFTWSAVAGASSYVLEASKDKSFPVLTKVKFDNIPNTTYTFEFADDGQGTWFARVYAVNSNGIAGVPSNLITFSVSFNAPLPPPPTPIAPVGGVTVTLPVTLSWTDVPNPQPQGYEVQIATDSGFRNIEDDIPLITPNSRDVLSLTAGTKFWRVRSFQGDNSPTTAAVTAWSSAASFIVSGGPVTVTGINLTRTPSAFSGDVEDGRIQLSRAAPPGGTVVNLTSSNPSAAPVPASVTVPEGFALSPAPFSFTLGQVTAPTPVTITATVGSSSMSVQITVQPPSLNNLSLSPSSITGGASAGGIVMLNGIAPPGGAVVSLTSSSPAVQPPASVTVAAGSPSVSFNVPTSAVSATTTATVTATWNGGSVQAQITLTPQVAPATLTISPTTTTGTNGSQGTVTLAAAANNDVQIMLSSSNPAVASVPPFVTVPQFAGGGAFFITTSNPSVPTTVTISASGAGVTKTATLTVNPFATGPSVSALSLRPTSVTGGGSSTGTVTLSGAAPAGGAAVTLSSSNTAAATVPASVTVPAGATSATFTVTSKAVTATSSATISATFGGATQSAVLTVSPAPAGPAVSTLSLSPTSVTGGGSSTATVTLSGAAPAGGAAVTLSSSNTAAATVPASVTVPAGATGATFTVTSKAVTATSSATISASFGGATQTAVLTVSPAAATTDKVSITLAEYAPPQLSIEATSTSSTATLQVFAASTGALIGTLTGDGSGRYKGQFSWPTNPQSITVKSSLGGSATATVTLK
jgi:hypothetical protein